ncbi:hypothetical protein [Klebsiella aerogenes]|uniref:hypothetical protein n=1 Tax=Klebsiella aerogenes TaxID=548 RepID=UPI00292F16C5|nr:hypothetical protein [Klebsiella aerogenes]
MKRFLPVALAAFPAATFPCLSLADAHYLRAEEVISHYYQPIDNKAAPWRKSREGAVSVTDYALCFNKMVNQHPQQTLVVMCPDMSQSTFDNEPEPTDLYVLEESEQGMQLVLAEQNVGYRCEGIVHIGAGKWAIHAANSAMNQGYGQTHDVLLLFVGNKFIPIAQWTSWLSNEGALAANDEGMEKIKNTLSVDTSQPDAEFYPVVIHSTGLSNNEKIDKTWSFQYAMDKGEYRIAENLQGGY